MRKRIGIAALAIIAIGVLALMVSGPKKGSVEYHKRAYVKAMGRAGKWYGVAPGFVRDAWERRRAARRDFHWAALIDAGYVTHGEFVVSNASCWDVADAVRRRVSSLGSDDTDCVWVMGTDTNVVLVAAPVGAINKLGEWIREADVP